MGLAESDLLYVYCPHRKLKSELHPYFIPNIPLFHYSIIPCVTYGRLLLLASEIKAWPSEPRSLCVPVNTIDGTIFYGVIYVSFRIDREFNDFNITGII
jgi:hypothetical protein